MNKYGWGTGHYKKKKLLCNIFAEAGAFTVMVRLTDVQYKSIYGKLKKYTQEYIDNKYPCGDGGAVIKAIHELPWSKCCATVTDKYGGCWWIAI